MPRIDPRRLLECLGVLLTQNGGIRSKEEVQRLASLMMKFSKKLVSKCVYILILKNTETDLLGLFMSAGGWTLVLTWLNDGIFGKNWALVTELLELLLMCPVDVERLKSNSIPRLVKGLSKDESLGKVNILATRLVEQWLKIVKDETVAPDREVTSTVVIVKQEDLVMDTQTLDVSSMAPEPVAEITLKNEMGSLSTNNGEQPSLTTTTTTTLASSQIVMAPQSFYKLTVRDGKQIIAKVDGVSANNSNSALIKLAEPPLAVTTVGEKMAMLAEEPLTTVVAQAVMNNSETVGKEKKENSGEKKSSSSSSSSSSKDRSKHERSKHRSSSSSKSSSSSRDKSGSSRDKSSSSNSSSSSSRDKDKHSRDRTKDKDKYKHRSNGSVKHSSSNSSSQCSTGSSSTNHREKQAEKDKDTLAKIQPKSVEKMGRIPKKSSSSSSGDDKSKSDKSSSSSDQHRSKPSISIEVRKKESGDRPKTVKVFHSKLRSTGLEEAARPPPSRLAVKKPTVPPPAVLPSKRPSPSREAPPPPEKRIKLPDTDLEKPGGIKLIPAKPKPAVLQESDMFMDALTASASNKKEPKKRKRRSSVSRDTNNSGNTSPPSSPSVSNASVSPLSSPMAMKGITAPKFYKDTLEPDEPKVSETDDDRQDNGDRTPEPDNSEDPMDEGPTENVVKEVDGIRGVLVYHKRRGPKKCVKWRTDSELEEVQYFELDETERVNVTKTFMDMKQMEHVGEREAMQLSRKVPNEDLMDERTPWKVLVPLDLKAALAESGKKSLEKDIQFAREKVILQALYFNRSMVPDSGAEPDPETHQMTDPVTIPLDDVSGNPDSVNDYQNTPWPEPKGSPPHVSPMPGGGPPMFGGGMPPFNPPMGPPGFHGMPQPFGAPNFMPPPNMMGGGGGVGGGGGGGGDWRGMPGDGSNMPPPDVNHVVGGPPMNPNMYNNRPDGGGVVVGGGFNNPMMDENNAGGFPPQGFGPGPMPGPPGPPGPMYPNFPQNNRGNNRGGFRNMGRGGWFRPSGPPPPGWHGGNRGGGGGGGNHWGGRGGGGGGGGGICKQFKMQGFCRQRDTCPFMHPPANNAPY